MPFLPPFSAKKDAYASYRIERRYFTWGDRFAAIRDSKEIYILTKPSGIGRALLALASGLSLMLTLGLCGMILMGAIAGMLFGALIAVFMTWFLWPRPQMTIAREGEKPLVILRELRGLPGAIYPIQIEVPGQGKLTFERLVLRGAAGEITNCDPENSIPRFKTEYVVRSVGHPSTGVLMHVDNLRFMTMNDASPKDLAELERNFDIRETLTLHFLFELDPTMEQIFICLSAFSHDGLKALDGLAVDALPRM